MAKKTWDDFNYPVVVLNPSGELTVALRYSPTNGGYLYFSDGIAFPSSRCMLASCDYVSALNSNNMEALT